MKEIKRAMDVLDASLSRTVLVSHVAISRLKEEIKKDQSAIKEIKENLNEIFGDRTWKDLSDYEKKMVHIWYDELKKVREIMNKEISSYRELKKTTKYLESIVEKTKQFAASEATLRERKAEAKEALTKANVRVLHSKEEGTYFAKGEEVLPKTTQEKLVMAINECVDKGIDPTESVQSILANG